MVAKYTYLPASRLTPKYLDEVTARGMAERSANSDGHTYVVWKAVEVIKPVQATKVTRL